MDGLHHRLASRLTPDGSAMQALKKVNLIVSEMLDTERAYITILTEMNEGYRWPLVNGEKYDASVISTIFSNIGQLLEFHREFSAEMSRHPENLVELANCFLNRAEDFEKLYVEFCIAHSEAMQVLKIANQSQTQLWKDILACQTSLGHLLPLTAHLLQPVQRVLKYQLLLQELVKGCRSVLTNLTTPIQVDDQVYMGDDNLPVEIMDQSVLFLQKALERMIQVASHINEEKRRHEIIDHLRATRLDVDSWGSLLLCDRFRLPARRAVWRLVLLFDRAILLGKSTNKSASRSNPGTGETTSPALDWASLIEIREVIECSNLMLIEFIDKNPLAFHILPFDNPKAQHTLQATSLEAKQQWCQEIKRVILENFDAAIPEKAKQLVLNIHQLTSTRPPIQPSALKAPKPPSGATLRPPLDEVDFPARDALPAEEHTSPISENISLLHDTWNALLQKHSTTVSTIAASASASDPATGAVDPEQVTGDEDFRCIAVEINEEKFALSSNTEAPTVSSPADEALGAREDHSPLSTAAKRLGEVTSGQSIYIDCPRASEYDTITFGRAYGQYIERTRLMSTLSACDLEEIFRPLLTLSELTHSQPQAANSASGSRPCPGLEPNTHKVVAGTASSEESSRASSPCQVVSRIAIHVDRIQSANLAKFPNKACGELRTLKQTNLGHSPPKREPSVDVTASAPTTRAYHRSSQINAATSMPKPPRIGYKSSQCKVIHKLSNQSPTRQETRSQHLVSSTRRMPSTVATSKNRKVKINDKDKDTEAEALCRGIVKAAFKTLLQPEPLLKDSEVFPSSSLAAHQSTFKPRKPPRSTTGLVALTPSNCNPVAKTNQIVPSRSPLDMTYNPVSVSVTPADVAHGHVRVMINRFQN